MSNNRTLKDEKDAKDLWETFNGPKPTPYTINQYQLDPEQTKRIEKIKSKQTEEKASLYADRIRLAWKNLKTEPNRLINVNLSNSPAEFRRFINFSKNQNSIKKSINRDKVNLLRKAIKDGNWKMPIFLDTDFPYVVMGLFNFGEITHQETSTLLEYWQANQDYEIKGFYNILDDNGQFTNYARAYFIPLLHPSIKDDEQKLEAFRLLVAALPPLEQFFYVSPLFTRNSLTIHPFTENLIRLHALMSNGLFIYHSTNGVRDALGITVFGIDQYKRPFTRLNKQSLKEIEEGRREQKVYASLHFPGTVPYEDKDIHGWENVPGVLATAHDFYHSRVLSSIPNCFLKALEHCVDISRNCTSFQWSKEIWTWVDGELRYFFKEKISLPDKNDIDYLKKMTVLFCNFLDYSTTPNENFYSNLNGGGLVRYGNLTLTGFYIFLNMIKQPDHWKEHFKIDPESLTEPYYTFYQSIKRFNEEVDIINNDPQIQIIKYKTYLQLSKYKKLNTEIAKEIYSYIDNQKAISKSDIIKKNKNKPSQLLVSQFGIKDFHNTLYYQPPKNIQYYKYARLNLNYSDADATKYVKKRLAGRSNFEAQFKTKPSFFSWTKANITEVSLLSLTIIGVPLLIIDGINSVQLQQKKINKVKPEAKPISFLNQSIFTDTSKHPEYSKLLHRERFSNTGRNNYPNRNTL